VIHQNDGISGRVSEFKQGLIAFLKGILGVVVMVVLLMVGLPLPVTFFVVGFGGLVILEAGRRPGL
jgi:hypothetical protein